jgi:hypothetical protein
MWRASFRKKNNSIKIRLNYKFFTGAPGVMHQYKYKGERMTGDVMGEGNEQLIMNNEQ